MPTFPYFEVIKRAYDLTRKNRWLWVFGLFIGGTMGFNLGILSYFLPPYRPVANFTRLNHLLRAFLVWVYSHPQEFLGQVVIVIAAVFILILALGLSKAAVIWAAAKLADPQNTNAAEPINFRFSLKIGKRYLWQIVGLQIFVTLVFLLFVAVFLTPVIYLFSVNALGKALVLSLLGLAIFIPASLVFGFVHLYGPIFIVLYRASMGEAVQLAFNLLRAKLKESVILAAFLIGLSSLFLFLVIFSIILLSLPIGVLVLLFLKLGFPAVAYILVLGMAVLTVCYVLILLAAFAVFQNIAWVLAVLHLVKTKRLEEGRLLVAEPVV